ncbi:Flavocytochrome c [Dendrothele bispora CBS 962.96]|uniref:Fumarate reductase n=1 Tax=Dendrothele bispora (strain CBS 962.96) TaxID=1314807 RepID=A0A4V4HCP5_DENBC|nr:Flavocytochrome c [Dendrothele bispora CBS 962.96]
MSTSDSKRTVIVIGGGLAGVSAAHTLLQHGASVVLLDKKPSLGGNSVKASSGINGAGTEAQKANGIEDSVEAFIDDTTISAGSTLSRPHLIQALTSNSSSALSWLTSEFGVDLSLVARLGGHSIPRTHRGKGGAPGWAITSALIKKLEQAENAKVLKGAKVVRVLQEEDEKSGGRVVGVEYESVDSQGEKKAVNGSVVVATGGYGADFSGFLTQFRPDLLSLPTTNGDHATGDGHRLVLDLAGSRKGVLCDMDQIQVHPTGFVDPANPTSKTKFLAAEALRSVGGLLVDSAGERFVNELDRRDAVTEKMQQVIEAGKAPIRMVMNVKAYEVLKAHCDFYLAKGLMKKYPNAQALTEDTKLPLETLSKTFNAHAEFASGKAKDPFGKTNFDNAEYSVDETLFVAEMTPVVHYTMGGITIDAGAHVLDADGQKIPGLYAAGEVIGGVHGKNRLGGSSLLEAVVFGRLAGENAAKDA